MIKAYIYLVLYSEKGTHGARLVKLDGKKANLKKTCIYLFRNKI